MDDVAGLPYAELRLDKDGERENPSRPLVPTGITDLLVVSHGWKNDDDDATRLYTGLIGNMVVASGGGTTAAGRRFAVIGIKWPAFRFRPDLTVLPADNGVPAGGGAAAIGGGDLSRAALAELAGLMAVDLRAADPAGFVADALAAAGGGGAADRFVDRLRDCLSGPPDGDVTSEHAEFLHIKGRDMVEALKQRGDLPPTPIATGEGGAAGLGSAIVAAGARVLRGGKAAIASALNQASYYEMKARAGRVGEALAAILEKEDLAGVQLHLIGHSFGARLVTSAVAAMKTLRPASLSLLQGAYSHNGLGIDIGPKRIEGGFRRVVADGSVTGPILITRSRHDSAVGFYYAVASKISGEIAKGLGVRDLVGGPKDLHGGLGANGALALRDGEGVLLEARPGALPALTAGKVNNVLADTIVADHNDVANRDIGALVWQAVEGAGG